jgi:hypothetical protein
VVTFCCGDLSGVCSIELIKRDWTWSPFQVQPLLRAHSTCYRPFLLLRRVLGWGHEVPYELTSAVVVGLVRVWMQYGGFHG